MGKIIKKTTGVAKIGPTDDVLVGIIEDVTRYHIEIKNSLGGIMDNAVKIGSMLAIAKKTVGFGKWVSWVEVNLPLSPRQVSKYIRVYSQRDELSKLADAGLNKTLALLAPSTDEDVDDEVEEKKTIVISERLKEANKAIAKFEKDRKKLLEDLDNAKLSDEDVSASLEKLKKQRDALAESIQGFKAIDKTLNSARKMFTKQLAILPTLRVTPRVSKAVREDVKIVVDLVDDWSALMRETFNV